MSAFPECQEVSSGHCEEGGLGVTVLVSCFASRRAGHASSKSGASASLRNGAAQLQVVLQCTTCIK